MAPTQNIFWCRVYFQAYIKHYRKMTDEQIVKDVRQSMDDLEDLVDNTDSFGSQMVRWAQERADEPFATAARENGKKGGRPKKKQETTADAPTREDGEFKSDSGDAGNLESATSANHYGVAATSDGAESFVGRESGCSATTTDSKNMRRVPQNEAPAHGFSGGRTAQGTMSRSPEAAAQSGKAYDQETDHASTNGHRQAEARQGQWRTGAPVRGATSSTAPVRPFRFRNKEEFINWAADSGLDLVDAGECWDATVERGWKDADGKPVNNIKAFASQWCATREEKRNKRRSA